MRPLRGEDPSVNLKTTPYARPLIRHPRVCRIRQTPPPLRSDLSPPPMNSKIKRKNQNFELQSLTSDPYEGTR